jgi:hypothetical protein
VLGRTTSEFLFGIFELLALDDVSFPPSLTTFITSPFSPPLPRFFTLAADVIAGKIANIRDFDGSPEIYAYGMIIALAVGFVWQFWASSKGAGFFGWLVLVGEEEDEAVDSLARSLLALPTSPGRKK